MKYLSAGVLCLLLYIGMQIYVRYGEEFEYVERLIRHSHNVEERVGLVQEVNLPLLGSFKETYLNDSTLLFMSVKVVGSKRTTSINIDAVRRDGAWKVEKASADGVQISLE